MPDLKIRAPTEKSSHFAIALRGRPQLFRTMNPCRVCAVCEFPSDKLRACSGCKHVFYCNRDCQTEHWKQHKLVCSPEAPPPKVKTVAPFLPGEVLDFKSQGLWYGRLRALIGADDEALGEPPLDHALGEAAKRTKTQPLSAQLEQVSLNRKMRSALRSKRTSSGQTYALNALRNILHQNPNAAAVRVSFQGESNEMLVVRPIDGARYIEWTFERESNHASTYTGPRQVVACDEGALAVLPIGLARRFVLSSMEPGIMRYPCKLSAEAGGSSCAFFSRRSIGNFLHICDVKPKYFPLGSLAGQFAREAELLVQPHKFPENDHGRGNCFNCGDVARLRCTGCNYVKLCSDECSELYWKFVHRFTCAMKSKQGPSSMSESDHYGSFVLMENEG